jgi:hypothetical protein
MVAFNYTNIFLAELKKLSVEKVLTHYQNQTKKKLDLIKNENVKNSNVKANNLNLKDVVSVLNSLQKDELVKLKLVFIFEFISLVIHFLFIVI